MKHIPSFYTIFTLMVRLIDSYIIDNGQLPECWGIMCRHNGTLDNVTCTCFCLAGYTGLFCETELKPTKWPIGRYSILSTVFGCPEDLDHGWHVGYVNMTLDSERPVQRWKMPHPTNYAEYPRLTPDPHILGPFTGRSLQLNFCTRDDFEDSDSVQSATGDSGWPSGNYCLLKYGATCPRGFVESHVTISEYHLSWYNTDGVLPYITIQHENVTMGTPTFYFCCQEDNLDDYGKTFPSTFPFIMIKTNISECSEIEGMEASDERFDFVDDLHTFNTKGSLTVFTDTGDGYQRLELCYYAPKERRECMFEQDGGFSYRGTQNTSLNGNPCIHWYEVKESKGENFLPHRQYVGDFDHNYCRTYWPWGELKDNTWCSVYVVTENGTSDEQRMEACDVPICDIVPGLDAVEFNKPVYSAEHGSSNPPELVVDGIPGVSFVAKRPQNKQWIQVDLEENLEVHAVLVERSFLWFPNNFRFPGVYISKYQWDFVAYGALQCTENNFPRRANRFWFQCMRPIVGQYVTIRNFDDTDPDITWGDHYILEIREITVYYKRGVCSRRLGLISGGIRDFQLGGSGDESTEMFDYGRIFNGGSGWCSSNAGEKYFEVDTIVPMVIHGIEIQGTSTGRYGNVKEISVHFGIRSDRLQPYLDGNNQTMVFKIQENAKPEMLNRFMFYRGFVARFIRIVVTSPEEVPVCMKMELIGCPKRVIRDVSCSNPESIDVGFEVLHRTPFWMENTLLQFADAQQCLEACNLVHCLSFSYSHRDCSVLTSTRYNPHFAHWVITELKTNQATYSRLCIRDVRDFSDCDTLITEPTVIESPLYPQYYGQLTKCVWTIQFPAGKYPHLQIIHMTLPPPDELADIQAKGYFDVSVGKCTDTLSFEGFSIDAHNATDYRNSMFISSASEMTLTLKSCARYSKATSAMFKINVTYSDVPGCGFFSTSGDAHCTSQHAIVAIQGFPTTFPLNTLQLWTIQGHRGQYVELIVKVLYLPGAGEDCRGHSVTVEDQSLQNEWVPIGQYCDFQSVIEPIRSSWHAMRIKFESGPESDVGNMKGAGFMAEYRLQQYVQNIMVENNPGCPEGWEHFNQSCYQWFSVFGGLTWIQAEDDCSNYHSGHLVSFHSRIEVNFIHYLLTEKWTDWSDRQADFYIGLKKSGFGGDFADYEWSDGSPATFLAWYTDTTTGESQPNGMNNELCTFLSLYSILSTDNWHDVACAYDNIDKYICEINLESTSRHDLMIANNTTHDMFYDDLFQCDSGELVQSTYICDGINDCSDSSDEACNLETRCPENGFKCNEKECIASYMLCDFVEDCSDGSDEVGCVFSPCMHAEWQCASGQCIPQEFRCDVKIDCIDGSDEHDCEICQGNTFQCYDQRCVTSNRICDSFYDCTGRFQEDEIDRNCTFDTRRTCSEWYALGRRSNGTFLINLGQTESFLVECRFGDEDGTLVVETLIHHDMENTLAFENTEVSYPIHYSATDEQIRLLKQISRCTQYIKFGCQQTTFWLRWVAFDGTFYENLNKTDSCDCPYVNKCQTPSGKCTCSIESHSDWYGETYFELRYDEGYVTNQTSLPVKEFATPLLASQFLVEAQITVGPLVCIEDSTNLGLLDLMVCKNGHITEMFTRCIMDMDLYGDINGCRDLSHLEHCEDFQCPNSFLKCPSSYCIPTRFVCDGVKHCPGGEDEQDSMCGETSYCFGLYRCRRSHTCIPRSYICDMIPHCPERDDEALCLYDCPINCDCSGFSMDCSSNNFSSIDSFVVFNLQLKSLSISAPDFELSHLDLLAYPMLNYLNVSHCGTTSLIPFHFNFTSNLIIIDISYNRISELRQHTFYGLFKLRSLFLKGNPLTYIDSLAFFHLNSLTSLDLSGFSFDNFADNVFVGLDSLNELNISKNGIKEIKSKQFESLSALSELDMRGNEIVEFDEEIFHGLNNLEFLYADSFTLCCVRPASVKEENCWPQKNEFSSCADLMRNEVLRVAIWIIGIAAFLGNIIVLFIRFYVERGNLGKTYSIFVTNLSVADFLMGVYLIIIAITDTVFRGSYVWNDYSWRNGHWCKMAGVLVTVGSEGSVLFLCLITIDRLLVVKFPFGNVRITKYASFVLCGLVWTIVVALAVVPLLVYSSFYSRSAVCLALPLTRDRPEGWQFSVGVFIVFNFLAFLLIATAQIVIYLEISSTRRSIASRGRRVDMAIARKLFFVAITDFLCWFPVGLMGILALRDHPISGQVYAWIAVFVLPINSAINPFLYTLGSSLSQARLTIKDRLGSQHSFRGEEKSGNVTEIFDSGLFMFGNGQPVSRLKSSLDQYLVSTTLTPKNAFIIALKMCRAVELLHSTEMIHGSVNSSSVIITASSQGKIQRVFLKSSPKFCSEEEDFKKDILDMGEVIKQILIGTSANMGSQPSVSSSDRQVLNTQPYPSQNKDQPFMYHLNYGTRKPPPSPTSRNYAVRGHCISSDVWTPYPRQEDNEVKMHFTKPP